MLLTGILSLWNTERAAAMAYRDAYLSHRRQWIYGEMFFAAAVAAARARKRREVFMLGRERGAEIVPAESLVQREAAS